eukprot:m.480421 g.480421  ORF g.480421 m.480421 type:complete len:56 (-) comp53186_c0_seq1:197-364(-)
MCLPMPYPTPRVTATVAHVTAMLRRHRINQSHPPTTWISFSFGLQLACGATSGRR